MNENEMNNLKEGIKSRYAHLKILEDRDFPVLYYNSTVGPYEKLIESILKHVSKPAPIPVPAAKTFAKIFHERYMIRNQALLDTLYRYAFLMDRQTYLANYDAGTGVTKRNLPIEVTIDDPVNGQNVDRILKATGSIKNGSNLWLIVRPSVSFNYWVQKEPKIYPDGRWEAFLHIGSADLGDIGITYEICAFVYPKILLSVEQVLDAWPEALQASSIIKVVRK